MNKRGEIAIGLVVLAALVIYTIGIFSGAKKVRKDENQVSEFGIAKKGNQ